MGRIGKSLSTPSSLKWKSLEEILLCWVWFLSFVELFVYNEHALPWQLNKAHACNCPLPYLQNTFVHQVLVTRTFRIYSLSNCQTYHTVALPIVIVLYIVSPMLIYPKTRSLYLLTNFTQFHHSQSLVVVTTNLIPFAMSLSFSFHM